MSNVDANKASAGKVNVGKVDVRILDGALAKLKLDRIGKKEERVQRLVDFFAELPKKDLMVCDVCGGASSKDFDFCPFCGDGEDEKPSAKPAAKGAKPSVALASPPAGEKVKEPPTAAVVVKLTPQEQALAKLTVTDLDASVKKIAELQRGAIKGTWELGRAIKDNFDRELWKLRRNEKGEPTYTNVREFWRQEFGYSHTYCYQLMEIASTFSKEDVESVGPTKLHLIMNAPPAAQPKLLEVARRGEHSVDQLRKAIDCVKSRAAGVHKPAKGTEQENRITVVRAPGRKTMPFFMRPASKDDEPKPAKRIEDSPTLEYEVSNSVKLRVILSRNAAGEIVGVVEFKRI